MNKKGNAERIKLSKTERQYVRGIIHNLSLQRWTSQEIADYLHKEKGLDIARVTVNRIRNLVEEQAAKWYVELKKSTTIYIAAYKERLDSLFSYQKKLHEIIDTTRKDEVKIRCVSELHSIEMDIFNLWKQLPNLDVPDPKEMQQLQRRSQTDSDTHSQPIFDVKDVNGLENKPEIESESEAWCDPEQAWVQCSHSCDRWFRKYVIKYHESNCPDIEHPYMIDHHDEVGYEIRPTGINAIGESEDEKEYFQCDGCKRWWHNQELLRYHKKKSSYHNKELQQY